MSIDLANAWVSSMVVWSCWPRVSGSKRVSRPDVAANTPHTRGGRGAHTSACTTQAQQYLQQVQDILAPKTITTNISLNRPLLFAFLCNGITFLHRATK